MELQPVTVLALPSGGATNQNEFLLCYNFVGVIVNATGRAQQSGPLRWLGQCHSFVLAPPFVLCFSDFGVQVR